MQQWILLLTVRDAQERSRPAASPPPSHTLKRIECRLLVYYLHADKREQIRLFTVPMIFYCGKYLLEFLSDIQFSKTLTFSEFQGSTSSTSFETSFISHKSSQRPQVLSISLFYSVSNYMVYDRKKYGILMGIRHIFKSRVIIMGLYLYFCFLTFGA